MGLFGLTFCGTCNNNEKKDIDDIKDRVIKLENKVEIIDREMTNSIQRLEDKLDNLFNLLNLKIDNLILVISNKKLNRD